MPITQCFFWIYVLIFAGIAAFLVIRATSLYGIGLSPDSTGYIRLARDITDNGFRFLSERKAISQPPLYPALLALVSVLIGSDPLNAARILNVVSLAALVVIMMLTVRRVTSYPPIILTMGILSCFSIPLIRVSSMAWTEPVFILIVYSLLFLISTSRPSLPIVLFVGFLTGLACLTRYPGIILIPLIFAYLLLSGSARMLKRLKLAFAFAVIPSLMFGLYILRNYAISSTALGSRAPSQTGFAWNINLATETFIAWFLPRRIRTFETALLALSCFIGVLLWSHRKRIVREFLNSHRNVLIFAGFFVLYTAFIVWTSTTTAYDRINSRLLSPVYPALLVLFSLVLKPETLRSRWRSILGIGLFVLLFTVTPIRVVVREVNAKSMQGAGGYNSSVWKQSQLVDHLRRNGLPGHGVVFSNAPDAMYILLGLTVKMSPAKTRYHSDAKTGITSENLFEKNPHFDDAILVWFDNKPRKYLFNPEELQTICSVKPIESFEDGTIYKIGRSNNRNVSDEE